MDEGHYKKIDLEIKPINIGEKIQFLRKSMKLTINDLSKKVNLSPGYISRIENSDTPPPITTLSKISYALNKHISYFFEEEHENDQPLIIKKDKRKKIMGDYTSFGFDYESLVLRKLGKMIDAFILTIKPGDDASKLPFSTHAGEELVFVLEGEISFYYADNIYTISKGDCIYYDPAISHKMVSASKEDPAKLLIIIAFLPDISE